MKWTKGKIEKLKILREKGLTHSQLARKLNTTENSIKMKVCRLGKAGDIRLRKHIHDDSYTFDSIDKLTLLKGLLIWWCEGTSYNPTGKPNRVEIVNSDPRLIYLFMHFLRKLKINEDKIKVRLKINKKEEEKSKKFWSELLDIPYNSFGASLRPTGIKRKTKSKYGTITIRYNSKKLAQDLYKRLNYSVQIPNSKI